MKYVFKSKRNTKVNLSIVIFITVLLISLTTYFLLKKFNTNINNNLIRISSGEIKKMTYSLITDKINNSIINTETIKDILVINKNNKDEILFVDFNLDKAYKLLDNVSGVLTTSFKEMENGEIEVSYLDKSLSHLANGFVLSVPFGSALKTNYFYNLGPKLPVKINFIGSVLTNLKTKVTNYGLNNALVEVYVYIEIESEIMTPFKAKEIKLEYDAIIASLMIEGEVPSFYNGTLENTSSLYSKRVE